MAPRNEMSQRALEKCESAADSNVIADGNASVLRQSWPKRDLYIAYAGLFATTFIIRIADNAAKTYSPFATSAFKKHSALTTANVVGTITGIVTFPIMAKFSNVFGRAEGLAASIGANVMAAVLMAACSNIGTYFAGEIFDSIGGTGYVIMMQVFIADTTSIINRGLWTSLPETITTIPALYLGTEIADSVLDHSTWRWGYGMWAVIIPFCAIPLVLTLYILQRRAARNGFRRQSSDTTSPTTLQSLRRLIWTDLDLFGAFLLVVSLSLALIPLTLTGSASNGEKWNNGGYIAMLVVGLVLFVVFLAWEVRYAEQPFIPFRMVKERTVVAACVLSMLDFFHYACFTIFFPSYLQVAGGLSPGEATRVDNALRVAFQIGSVVVGLLIKYTRRTQIWVYTGIPMMVLGQGLMIYFVNVDGVRTANTPCLVTAKTLVGLGRAFFSTAAQVSIQALVARDDVPVVTGAFYAAMSFGSSIGTTVGGGIWNNVLPVKLAKYLPEEDKKLAKKIYGSMVFAKEFAKGTPVRNAIDRSYRETSRLLAIASTVSLGLMLFVMFSLKTVDLNHVEDAKLEANKEIGCEGDGGITDVARKSSTAKVEDKT